MYVVRTLYYSQERLDVKSKLSGWTLSDTESFLVENRYMHTNWYSLEYTTQTSSTRVVRSRVR